MTDAVLLPASTLTLLSTPLAESAATGAVVLADPATTAEAGLKWPVYFSRLAWDRHVAVTPAAEKMLCDERGRLWDVLWLMVNAMRGFYGILLRFQFHGVVDAPRVHACTLFALIAEQGDRPYLVVVTAEEALGAEEGGAIDGYDRMLAAFDDGDDGDRGDPLDW